MHFDDRLATVLRHRAAGERAARTQFRQLLDLLGSRNAQRDGTRDDKLLATAWLRLGALGEAIPAPARAAMIREAGLRFRNPELAVHLAEDEPEVAAAALARAELDDEDWEALIPRLPVRARGFLRLRRDLTPATARILERLGVHDRGLPQPVTPEAENIPAPPIPVETAKPATAQPVAANDTAPPAEDETAIGALVRRIEAVRQLRSAELADTPLLPLIGGEPDAPVYAPRGFDFTTDAAGRINWADARFAPMVMGASLALTAMARAIRYRQPVRALPVTLEGGSQIAGDWIIDAAPRFTRPDGRFFGYAGTARRPVAADTARQQSRMSSEADRLRQLLHELRTPVNAIQGFSEVIQQQLFGPTPHEYRALAASIAGDSARMLAGFDELDRLARLETGALQIESGASDFPAIIGRMVEQLESVLRPRTASFELTTYEGGHIPASTEEAEVMAWRLLATLAAHIGAGEHLQLEFTEKAGALQLSCELPMSLATTSDLFAASASRSGTSLSSGMFGAGFSLRLVKAEAKAMGGMMDRVDDWLVLTLPLLTDAADEPSPNIAGTAG